MSTKTYLFLGLSCFALLTAPAYADDSGDDIIVTAQKRSERAIDVPGALTAIDGDRLDMLGVKGIQDLAAITPGLIVAGTNRSQSTLIIRGITTSSTAPSSSVGIVIDGTPVGSSSSYALGGSVPIDVNPADLERVEVLRGPQGTLYGASTLGGLVSYVTKAPSLTAVGGSLSTAIETVEGGGFGYTARGAFTAPVVEDHFGLRISGFYDRLPGYVDNPLLGTKDVNRSNAYGVRAAMLIKPVDALSITLSAQAQNLNRRSLDGVSYDFATGEPIAGSRDQLLNNPEPYRQRFRQYAGKVEWDLGPATLTSMTSWQRIRSFNSYDYSAAPLGQLLIFQGGGFVSGATLPFAATTHKFTQEVRLTSDGSGPFRWMIGGFHTDEDSFLGQQIVGIGTDGKPFAPFAPALDFQIPTSFREDAAFGNLSFDISDRLQISGGLRYSDSRQRFDETVGGPIAPILGIGGIFPTVKTSEDVLTYSASVKYSVADGANIYARAASGYRPGGPNLVLPGIASRFKADKLDNYEVGFKSRFLEGKANIDVALFWIDYRDIQLTGSAGGLLYFTNGKSATSKGVEASGSLVPVPGLTVAANVAYTDATLDDAVPELGARDGERLPATPKFAGSVSADYRWAVATRAEGFVGASARYIGKRPNSFDASVANPQFVLGDSVVADLRAGIDMGGLEIAVQVRNLTDERAEMYATTTYGRATVSIVQPRSYGASLTKRF
jgi:outer membrane receptor protein involved in Fe transport